MLSTFPTKKRTRENIQEIDATEKNLKQIN